MDSRWLAGIAAVCGAYVAWSELNFKGNSTLTPILLVLGVGLVAQAAAHFVHRHRMGPPDKDADRFTEGTR